MKFRPAKVADAGRICDLINYYAERGKMLHRSLESVYGSLREFIVAENDGKIVGCVAVSLFWSDLAEVRSLAVCHQHRGMGIGGKLVREAIKDCKDIGVHRLFALTYEKEFFDKLGFKVIDRKSLPEKVWRVCLHCPKADACDETAMVIELPDRKPRPAKSPAVKSPTIPAKKRRVTRPTI